VQTLCRPEPFAGMPVLTNPQPSTLTEQAGYLALPGAHLYTVLHQAPHPVARVLLAGPFASERLASYLPWIRWARYLADRGFEVLRYDHRGIGESEGIFETITFKQWNEDLRHIAHWYSHRSPNLPFILHGLGIGALYAANLFQQGTGNALLMWSPPEDANQALRSILLRSVGLGQMLQSGAGRKSASYYIRELQEGSSIEVEGYLWSAQLWQESFQFKIPFTAEQRATFKESNARPVRLTDLPPEAAPLVKGGYVGYDDFKDFTWLWAEYAEWMLYVANARG
jgi:hypothetical protein